MAVDAQGAARSGDSAPTPVAIICVDPKSGDESHIQLGKQRGGSCPPGHTSFIAYEIQRAPGAAPLATTGQNEQEQAEVRNAPMDRQ